MQILETIIMKYFSLILIGLMMSACNTTGPTYYPASSSRTPFDRFRGEPKRVNADMPTKPGACFARCLMPNVYESTTDTLGIYADNAEIPPHILEEQEVVPATEKWVKKKSEANCHSSDPDDCLVWCLQTTPAINSQPVVTKDNSEKELGYVVQLERKILIKQGGHTEWQEVVCENKITPNFTSSLRSALNELGYDAGISEGITSQLKEALVLFQKENTLPVGQLDFGTLTALGVSF